MLTHEEAFYHKLLLEVGVTGELEPVLDRLLAEEEPLSDVTLRLAYCHSDPNEQLSALNEYLSGVSFESMDTNAVFEKLRAYFRKAYEADPDDLKRLSGLMYRISNRTGHELEEPWFQLWMVGEYYDCVEDLSMHPDDFRERLVAFLYRGEKVYPWKTDQAQAKHGKKLGILPKLRELLFGKREGRSK